LLLATDAVVCGAVSKVISLTGEQSVVVLARYRVLEEAPDAMDYKSLKKQGFLTKQGGGHSLLGRKSFKKRFFELRDGILSYSEQPNEPDLGVIVLKGVRGRREESFVWVKRDRDLNESASGLYFNEPYYAVALSTGLYALRTQFFFSPF